MIISFVQDEHVALTSTPPMYLKCDLRTYNLLDLNNKFDVILIEPPLEEYQRTIGATNLDFWSWEQVSILFIFRSHAFRYMMHNTLVVLC